MVTPEVIQEMQDYCNLMLNHQRKQDQEDQQIFENYQKTCKNQEQELKRKQKEDHKAALQKKKEKELEKINQAHHEAMIEDLIRSFATGGDRLIDDQEVLTYRDQCLRLRNDPDTIPAYQDLISTISKRAEFIGTLSPSDLTEVVLDYIIERAFQIENPDEEEDED